MNCKDVKKYLSDYIDGLLPSEMKEEFESHLNQCSECRSLVEDVKAIQKETLRIKIPQLNPYMFQRIKHRVESETQPSPFRVLYRVAMGMSFILIAIALSLYFFKPSYRIAGRSKDLYIIKEEKSGYQFPVYTSEGNYVLTSYQGGTF
ncbi:hypothetical protein DRQ23_04630 [bacterium]|nr:MAG: hypothetical protein DRQ23_04630 [bacterium]